MDEFCGENEVSSSSFNSVLTGFYLCMNSYKNIYVLFKFSLF